MAFRITRVIATVTLAIALLALATSTDVIAGTKDAEAKKYTEQLQKSKDPKVRAAAIEKIGELAQINKKLGEAAVADIKIALKDKDVGVRKAAAKAYGCCDPDDSEAVASLIDLLKNDREDAVKMNAALGLQAMGEKAKTAVPEMRIVAKSMKNDRDTKALNQIAKSISGNKKN